ncbi:DNA mismatch repair protein MutL [Dothidotthia symphoricarpi CBS 119687]|uniref:DNA mismatch repair protein PMS1 n=1 Tax=Dothidotthia symphoricarpi CBS 119687 TaxID=1392245 RepID=A0A6A6AAP4_9PLEO|nr:DNA mismatch repair protein MutL [Dothidotthia symphoricarpi CBS 119687]KAF2127761.1 DNA mismatch repair protein MutL [Dothidotthia symphoricarpi CBS 119687]
MATIKPIEGRSVHQIQSGQVIVDLQSVCKELVENSIDAGATSIEVRFRNNGLDAIEVQDNGGGIAPPDYETIALKHYTSKLSTYDDLSSLQTFGFRGEALSSLCALSRFHIVTARPADGAKGTRLDFEQSGRLKGTSVVAAKQGTTVVVETLFHNLPVRRKELEKNVKREYSKVLALLNAYACISVGIKFSVSNHMPKGKKSIAFATNANPNTKDNISNVYGAKTISALIPLTLDFEMDPSNRPDTTHHTRNLSTQQDSSSRAVKIVGHISRPVVGEGRQTPDRQMFFVNSRPCNLPQIAKAFNEVYKSFNITQSPFVFADLRLDPNAYDVNVSPDKRTIMLHDQTALLENLKESLMQLFEQHEQSVPQAHRLGHGAAPSATKALAMGLHESIQPSVVEARNQRDSMIGIRSRPPANVGVSTLADASTENTLPGFVKASLIERFAGRDTEERLVRPPPKQRRESSLKAITTTDEHIPVIHNASPEHDHTQSSLRQESQSPLFEPEQPGSAVLTQSVHLSKALENFTERTEFQQVERIAREQSLELSDPTAIEPDEPNVPVIEQTPQRSLSQSTIQNAFDRMRPMRTPAQQATITVGGTTTLSTVVHGSQTRSSKRARIHTPKYSLDGTPLNQTSKRMLFTKSLHGLAAPGTQTGNCQEQSDDDEQDDMPRTPARSPSPRKPLPRKAFEVPESDDLVDLSSAPPAPSLYTEDRSLEDVSSDELVSYEDAEDSSAEYLDESEKKIREDAKVAQMIAEAEDAAAGPTDVSLKRASRLFKVSQNKYWTINLERVIETDVTSIARHVCNLQSAVGTFPGSITAREIPTCTQLSREDPEERLSLTVQKEDFNRLRIIGQFNRGFIVAVLPPTSVLPTYNLFIIDQHASDEKYNFERLSASTELSSQRLVHPHTLELTAVEEEIILANKHVLTANGFVVDIDIPDDDADVQVGRHTRLTSLPMSRDVTFTLTDLEELLALLLESPPSSSSSTSPYIPRPSKIRKLLASRACRSSVMVGRTLQDTQMESIVRHMGTMDKPWSCPHGRPTMRHLHKMDDEAGWSEGDGIVGMGKSREKANWKEFISRYREISLEQ